MSEIIKGTWITFIRQPDKPKTQHWKLSSADGTILGEIKWYPSWRQYTYFPFIQAVYEEVCLREIADFVERLTKEHDG